MKVVKKEAEAKEVEKLFRHTRESENIRDNMEILFKNRNELDSNEKKVEEYINRKEKEIEKLTIYQRIGKSTTIAGGGLALSGSIMGSALSSAGYSQAGILLPLVSSGIGGLMSLTGSSIELYVSGKEKFHQEEKKVLEIEKAKKISEKSLRDFNRLKDN